ncbi:MAG TPA: response regulator [Blastocatellia bacterium]|nr:response regulator [Blastocatellia bacterium]
MTTYNREKDGIVEKKILVVDDSTDTREMMAKLLELERFAVITAEDGRTGLNKARQERPDLIITDVNMPHLDGIQMICLLREENRRIPILAITAYGSSVAADAISAGADRAFAKPVEFDSLIDQIRELLSLPGTTAGLTSNGFTHSL